MILTYDAVDSRGQRTSDQVEAISTAEAVDQLRSRGLFVTRIKESDLHPSRRLGPARTFAQAEAHGSGGRPRLPLKVVALFTRQMAMLLRSGSGIVPAITAIKKQMKKPQQAALLGQIVTDLEEGATLTDSLRKHPGTFDAVYCAITAAGEASGTMNDMYERLADIVGKRRAMRNKILGALAYPILLILMCVSILNVLLFFVLPRFRDMFVQLGVPTPTPTRLLLAAGGMMRDYWALWLAILVVLAGSMVWLLVGASGRQWLSNVQTQIPVFGRLRTLLIQAQVVRTMGMLLASRVGVLESLELVRRSTRNRRFQKLFDSVEDTVTSGGHVSTAFEESGLMQPQICQAIRTGEDSGNLGGAMTYCADVLDESNAELIQVVTKLIEPLILIVMGVVVGGVAISLFLPLFDMTAAMK